MKEQRIIIEIDANGGISADADGFSGEACLRELDRLLEGLAKGPSIITPKRDGAPPPLAAGRSQRAGQTK